MEKINNKMSYHIKRLTKENQNPDYYCKNRNGESYFSVEKKAHEFDTREEAIRTILHIECDSNLHYDDLRIMER